MALVKLINHSSSTADWNKLLANKNIRICISSNFELDSLQYDSQLFFFMP